LALFRKSASIGFRQRQLASFRKNAAIEPSR
jgi:hypothetical protein